MSLKPRFRKSARPVRTMLRCIATGRNQARSQFCQANQFLTNKGRGNLCRKKWRSLLLELYKADFTQFSVCGSLGHLTSSFACVTIVFRRKCRLIYASSCVLCCMFILKNSFLEIIAKHPGPKNEQFVTRSRTFLQKEKTSSHIVP